MRETLRNKTIMDPISNSDRMVALLRQKLEERMKAARAPSKPGANVAAPSIPTGVQALAALDGADDRSLRRALIQHLLAGQLDPSLMNDAQFQQMVTRVTEAIEDDHEASQLMTRVLAELKPS